MLLRLAATIVLTLSAAELMAAEIVLRERCVPAGSVVRLGDVADIGAATPAECDALTTAPLTPAPAAGVNRYLRASEVRDLLALRGVDVANLHFSGSPLVSIGSAPAASPRQTELGPTATDPAAVRAAIESHLLAYLKGQSENDLWRVEIVDSEQRIQELSFAADGAVVSGGQAPWTGRQKFTIADRAGGRSLPIFVRVIKQEQAVVALRAIERGQLISGSDVALTTIDNAVPTAALRSLAGVVGQEARNAIPLGAVLTSGNLRAPIVVRRGELSTVVARAAGVVARTLVTPQQDGSVGDLVIVEAGEKRSKRRFTARVTGYRELEVFAAPASAADLARF
ncbi:MAG: flagellar basal body P-ring formation protein FlgA [Planctomycetales bacterium]|nr:flagellar basal body P-ring formation protein FlgA [Planctomycetales bacterium]